MSVIGQEKGIKHGTTAGYKQHLYRKVPACDPCLQASREAAKQKPSYTARKTTRRAATAAQNGARARRTAQDAVHYDGSSMGVVHGDTAREHALTYIPYVDEQGHQALRRERVKAALVCLLLDPDPSDVIEMLGVPDDEVALAYTVKARLGGGR